MMSKGVHLSLLHIHKSFANYMKTLEIWSFDMGILAFLSKCFNKNSEKTKS